MHPREDGRGKMEDGRWKKEEGRRKKEEGRGKREVISYSLLLHIYPSSFILSLRLIPFHENDDT
jgi:uncharacterized protein Veg